MADNTVQSLRHRVEEKITAAGSSILDRTVAFYVEAEAKRRADLIIAGVNELRQAEVDLNKVNRGDNITYNADGSVANTTYTKNRLDEIRKANERVAKLSTALDNALVANTTENFKKLEELVKKSGNKSTGDSEA